MCDVCDGAEGPGSKQGGRRRKRGRDGEAASETERQGENERRLPSERYPANRNASWQSPRLRRQAWGFSLFSFSLPFSFFHVPGCFLFLVVSFISLSVEFLTGCSIGACAPGGA